MSAVTRWVEYDVLAAGIAGTGGGSQEGEGTRGYIIATGASDTDTFDIGAGNNLLYATLNGDSGFITLASGTALDPRFVARNISEKLHDLGKGTTDYNQAQCVWENNQLKLYSGVTGSSSSITVTSGTNTAHLELGFGSKTEAGGSTNNPATGTPNQYNGGITVSGTYNGFFDETYTIIASRERNIDMPVKGGNNGYTGTITVGGHYNHTDTATLTYTINISTANATTTGGGTGFVPIMTWTSTGNVDNSSSGVELLYPNYFYNVGTRGLMVKFTDRVFSHCPSGTPAYTIDCHKVAFVEGSNSQASAGTAMYIWGSTRGDDAESAIVTSQTEFTRLGTRGLYIKFTGDSQFLAQDQWKVICSPPKPKSYDITNLEYNNVTVSTESPVRCVIFEIMSGAIEISTVKFGLQNHGSFTHHNENNSNTFFRFGTVGPGESAGSSPIDGMEWHENVLASDIATDNPPVYLHATEDNLSVVSDADYCEDIGSSSYMGMVSDPIFLNIKLGASEVGANSTINYRVFFDFS